MNIGVGPSNAKTITDHVGVLRPDALIMIGHCGGLRNHQDIGDFVLATAYLRGDHVLDDVLPIGVPVTPNHYLNRYLLDALVERDARFRLGTVFTTDNRNWEFNQRAGARCHRGVAQRRRRHGVGHHRGQRLPLPHAQRHPAVRVGQAPARPAQAQQRGRGVLRARSDASTSTSPSTPSIASAGEHPAGVPAADIRSTDEPLFGTPTEPDPT